MPPASPVEPNQPNALQLSDVWTVLVPLAGLDPAIHDDEVTLESTDGSYKKTLKVIEVAQSVDGDFLAIDFPGVKPGLRYRLTWDLKHDEEGEELGSMVLLDDLLISAADLNDRDPAKDDYDEDEDEEDVPLFTSLMMDPAALEAIAGPQQVDEEAEEEWYAQAESEADLHGEGDGDDDGPSGSSADE